MTPAHTPGPFELSGEDCPWTCGDSRTAVEQGVDFGHAEILTPLKAGDETVAYLPWEPLCDDERAAELRANASLLAAAPEMAEVLRKAVKVLDADGITYGDTGDDTEPLDVLREARALLARIDGTA